MLVIIGSAVFLFVIIIAIVEGKSNSQSRQDDSSYTIMEHQEKPSKSTLPSAALRSAYFAIRRQAEVVQKQTVELHYDTRERDMKTLGLEFHWEKQGLQNLAEQQEIVNQHRELDQKKVSIEQLAKEKDLEIKGKEIELAEKALLQRFKDAEQSLRDQILNFKSQQLSFQEEMASIQWDIRVQNDLLSIREAKIELLDQRIKDMYFLNSEWLKIQARQNKQDYSDQQVRLKKLYDETQVKIKELRLTRWANDLRVDQQEVDRKWKIMQYIEEKWTSTYLERRNGYSEWIKEYNPGNSLKDLRQAGFAPESPLLLELAKLKNDNWQLQKQLQAPKK
jgi:hypothetical protein